MTIIVMEQLIRYSHLFIKQRMLKLKPRHNYKKIIVKSIWILLLIAAPFTANRLWENHLRQAEIGKIFNMRRIKASRIIDSLSSSATARDKKTYSAFNKAITDTNTSNLLFPEDNYGGQACLYINRIFPSGSQSKYISCWIIFLFCLAGFAFVAFSQKSFVNLVQIFVAGNIWATGYFLYALGLLFMYLCLFTEYEGVRLASFIRYMNTYNVAGVLFLSFLSVQSLRWRKVKTPAYYMLIILSVLILFGIYFMKNESTTVFRNESNSQPRDGVEKIFRSIPKIPPGKKVWIIWQNSNGYEFVITRYLLNPNPIGIGPWSLKINKEGLYTAGWTPQKWASKLSDCDYLFLGRTDEAFWEAYGKLFAPGVNCRKFYLYKVEKADKKISLVPVSGSFNFDETAKKFISVNSKVENLEFNGFLNFSCKDNVCTLQKNTSNYVRVFLKDRDVAGLFFQMTAEGDNELLSSIMYSPTCDSWDEIYIKENTGYFVKHFPPPKLSDEKPTKQEPQKQDSLGFALRNKEKFVGKKIKIKSLTLSKYRDPIRTKELSPQLGYFIKCKSVRENAPSVKIEEISNLRTPETIKVNTMYLLKIAKGTLILEEFLAPDNKKIIPAGDKVIIKALPNMDIIYYEIPL
ncbi:MAG: hypothetical protein PHV82_00400 [Victivallaceae bacterium]|nr:hypothetical protein [Victivallaceae bacterium]